MDNVALSLVPTWSSSEEGAAAPTWACPAPRPGVSPVLPWPRWGPGTEPAPHGNKGVDFFSLFYWSPFPSPLCPSQRRRFRGDKGMRGASRRTEPPCQRHPRPRPALPHGLLGRARSLGAPRLPGRDTQPGNGRRQGGDREKGQG